MPNLQRGFRRLTWVISVLLASPFLVDGALSLFEKEKSGYFFFVAATIGFILPWLVFFVARWIAAGFRQD
jgi:hypothetical protein